MATRLEGRVALITGGTSGIGESTVELFVEEGAKVVVAGRSEEAGKAIVDSLGPSARFCRCDVTREDEIRDAIDFAKSTFGRLDILFNNAGAGTRGGPETVTADQFHYAMDLLVGSVLFGIKYAAPIMKEQQYGRIINNASVAASRTNLGDYLYSAAKAAVVQLTKVAGLELGPFGITVNTIPPAPSPRRSSTAAPAPPASSNPATTRARCASSRATSPGLLPCTATATRATSPTLRSTSPATRAPSSTATTSSSMAAWSPVRPRSTNRPPCSRVAATFFTSLRCGPAKVAPPRAEVHFRLSPEKEDFCRCISRFAFAFSSSLP